MKQACPECGFHWSWHLSDGRRKCRRCRHRYTIRTIWQSFRIDEAIKRKILDYFCLGVPVYRLRFHDLASRPVLDRFYRCCRMVMALDQECMEPFDGDLELDETMFGGRRKGKRGWGASGKVIVFGILKRNGQVRVFPIPRRNREEMMRLVRINTKPGSLYFTDDWHAYASLALRGNHVVVRKSGGIPMGRDHINGIEGFWSYAKHWLYPLRGVPKKLLHIFLGEISYRFNHREENLYPLILKLLRNTEIKASKHYLVRNP